jgi:ABC-type multidrug transport system ATPase subunit/pSer/pThr/pTyr-binding forkhead associated (FHA) protein/ABC-type multidrug transport system permease subunit
MTAAPPVSRLVVGSDLDCDVPVVSDFVSARHCGVTPHPVGFLIEDLASKNGVYVDGRRIDGSAIVPAGANVTLGRSVPLPWDVIQSRLGMTGATGDRTLLGAGSPADFGPIDLGGRDGSFVLGRASSCGIRITHPMVSARHACLTIHEGIAQISDLGSANGTFVNGRRINRGTTLQAGDTVSIGPVVLTLSTDGRRLAPRAHRGEVTIEARGVGVTVGARKRLLAEVDLAILPGELVGLMGPSGAGKSTLISALNGYLPPSEGSVAINGRDLYAQYDEFRGMIGYVPQDDIMHADLTVAEALYFTARLRLPADHSDAEIRSRIATVLADLGLTESAGTRIGNAERRGISGGQRKRVNVAMELLTDPPLLFLDEPTSGLSSEDALTLMQLLRRLADKGKTVILTIDQPSLDVYRLMDNLIVVGKDGTVDGGRVAYYGPAFPDAITFFSEEADAGPIHSADGVLRGLGRRPVRDWVARYRLSPHHAIFVRNRLSASSGGTRRPLARRRPAHGLSQFFTLARRGLAVKLKDTWNTGILLLQAPLIALLVGLLFGGKLSRYVDLKSFADVAGPTATTMFLLGVAAIWFGCSNAAREIVAEMAIFRRERMVGLGIPSYVASKLAVLSLLCAFQCAVLLVIVGTFGRLAAPWSILFVSLLVASCVGVAIGLLVSALARSGEVAAGVLPLVILPMVIFGGVLLPLPKLPRKPLPMNVVAQVMPSRWAFESLILPEAYARPAIDTNAMPPRIVSAQSLERPRLARDGELEDMAETFLPFEDGWRSGQPFAVTVMACQAAGIVCLVALALRRRDIC